MAEHSILSPSSAERWMGCPASLLACEGVPPTTSEFAKEGTVAHKLAEEILKGTQTGPCDQEMHDAVMIYVNNVRDLTKKATWKSYEEKVDLSAVLGYPDQLGTADCLAIVKHTLQVHDLKYGKGVVVSAVKNKQMMLYALGGLEVAELISDSITKVKIFIHQPRVSEEPSEYEIDVDELKLFGMQARGAAQKAMCLYESGEITDADFGPSEEACLWCPIKGTCKHRAAFAMKSITDDFDNLDAPIVKEGLLNPAAMTATQIAKILSVESMVSDWLDSVKKKAQAALLAGEKIPGWKLVEGRQGNRKWGNEKVVEEYLSKTCRLKTEDMYKMTIISPTEAEKVLGETRWKRISANVVRAPGAKQIAPESDKRPAFVPGAVEAEFENLNDPKQLT